MNVTAHKMSWLFVGLGNPGDKYARTRHNLGEMIVRTFAQRHALVWKVEKSFKALAAKGAIDGNVVHLLLPTTFMNNSGQAVRPYLDYYRLPLSSLVVVSDDIALPFASFRLRSRGASGGHNGLESVQAHLASSHYARLKAGVGAPHTQQELADYVLEPFNSTEQALLPTILSRGADILELLLSKGFDRAMSEVNVKQKKKPPSPREQENNNYESQRTQPI